MTRVLISALGAGVQGSGGYKTTTYNIDGKDYTDVAFIARALCEHYRINRLFMVGTERSIWDEFIGVLLARKLMNLLGTNSSKKQQLKMAK